MTYVEFVKVVGRPPEDDDLQRVNCEVAGTTGHWQCGWCWTHNKPRFECACFLNDRGTSK